MYTSTYKVWSRIRALVIIYDFMQLDLLTMPECNLVSSTLPVTRWKSISRALDNIPPTLDDFLDIMFAEEWVTLMCIAGTERTDTRRVVFQYDKEDKSFFLNFPTDKALTRNEKAIKSWVDDRCGY